MEADVELALQRADQAVLAAEAQLSSARRDIVPDLTLRAGEQWNNELVRQKPNIAAGAQTRSHEHAKSRAQSNDQEGCDQGSTSDREFPYMEKCGRFAAPV